MYTHEVRTHKTRARSPKRKQKGRRHKHVDISQAAIFSSFRGLASPIWLCTLLNPLPSFLPHFSLRWVVLGISCRVPFVLICRVWQPLFTFLHLYFGTYSRDVSIYFPTLCACIVHDVFIYIYIYIPVHLFRCDCHIYLACLLFHPFAHYLRISFFPLLVCWFSCSCLCMYTHGAKTHKTRARSPKRKQKGRRRKHVDISQAAIFSSFRGLASPILVMYSFKLPSFLPHFSLRWVVLGISCRVSFVLISRVWQPLFTFLHLYFGSYSRDVGIYFPTLCACIVHDVCIYTCSPLSM